jgi:4-amino-4-deoxy-L-arabinose transferase-like glycosyltransferase
VRLVFVFVVHPPYDYLFSDMQAYVERAVRVASGAAPVHYDAFYPPGTHLLLAGPLKLFGAGPDGLRGAAALWWALASAVPLFSWKLTKELFDARAAALAAALVAVYPLLFFYAGFFSAETPAIALLLPCLWLGYRARRGGGGHSLYAVGAGALGGAAAAVRPQLLLNVVIMVVPLLTSGRVGRRASFALLGGFGAVMIAVLAYNAAAAGSPTGLAQNGGIVFYQAHCDVHQVTAGSPRGGGVWRFANPVAVQRGTGKDRTFTGHEVWDQGFFYGKAFDCIRRDGFGHLRVLGRALLDATATTTPFPFTAPRSLAPIARAVNLAYSILLPIVVLGGVAVLARRRRRGGGDATGIRELLLHLLAFVPVVMVFSSEPRYRIPYDVFGLILLGALLSIGAARRDGLAAPSQGRANGR